MSTARTTESRIGRVEVTDETCRVVAAGNRAVIGVAVAASILHSLVGGAGLGGRLESPTLLLIAAIVSMLVPSTHEIRSMRPMPWPAIAVGAAVLSGFCLLEVGNGPPLNFIYFQF